MALLLVVDDDYAIVLALQMAFEKLGHEVLTCMDGLDAISLLSARRPVAIVADWQMGAVSGIEVLAAAQEALPTARRILITASPTEPEVKQAVLEGTVQLLLEKPWLLSDLRGAVRGL